MDLGRYIAAQFGSTPGQQIAQLAMVTPAQVKRARAEAEELGISVEGLAPIDVAHLVKAKRLAKALGVTTAEAWAAGHKARVDLLPYTHQRQAQAKDPGEGAPPVTVFMVPSSEGQQSLEAFDSGEDEGLEILSLSPEPAEEVGRDKSDEGDEPLTP
jgi:hypothetical protein